MSYPFELGKKYSVDEIDAAIGPMRVVDAEVLKAVMDRRMSQMTADAFRKCREATGLGVVEYGIALGYQGSAATISRLIRSFEDGTKTPPNYIQRLCLMLWRHGIPNEFLTDQAIETRRLKGLAR